MGTTSVMRNWSRPDVFEVSRDMLREFAKNGHLQHSQIMLDKATYMIVCSISKFGHASNHVCVECWDSCSGLYPSNKYCDSLKYKVEYFEDMDLDCISNDSNWQYMVAATHYEVWHVVDKWPDWYMDFVAADVLSTHDDVACFDLTFEQLSDWIQRGTVVDCRFGYYGSYLVAMRHVSDMFKYYGPKGINPSMVFMFGTLDSLSSALLRIYDAEGLDWSHGVECQYEIWHLVD